MKLHNIFLKKIIYSLAFCLISFSNTFVFGQFNEYFEDKTMRVDYYHSGNDSIEFFGHKSVIEEPYWAGTKISLIHPFNYGTYHFRLIDLKTEKVIYTQSYCSLFNEWKTTPEAKIISRTFVESVVFPYPKSKIRLEIHVRNSQNIWDKKFEIIIDPTDYFIEAHQKSNFTVLDIHKSGESDKSLDIVFIPDGYTCRDFKKFKKDCKRYADYLLNCKPFSENKNKINIRAVFAPSKEKGTDIPGKNVWKNTVLNTHFYTFNSERYLTTGDFDKVRDVASHVPYDQIVILANTSNYGGGGFYNFYTCISSDNNAGDFLLVHEFGHSFAGLADEYYDSEVSMTDYHSLEIEPWEPNITTLVNFESKWKDMIDKSIAIPTPAIKVNANTVGVYEGAGYVAKGVFRPHLDCTMKSVKYDAFCPVCIKAIQKMIDFYCE